MGRFCSLHGGMLLSSWLMDAYATRLRSAATGNVFRQKEPGGRASPAGRLQRTSGRPRGVIRPKGGTNRKRCPGLPDPCTDAGRLLGNSGGMFNNRQAGRNTVKVKPQRNTMQWVSSCRPGPVGLLSLFPVSQALARRRGFNNEVQQP